MELNGKGQSLKLVFLKYLLSIAFGLAVSAGLALILLAVAGRFHGIVAADATEQSILQNKSKIAEAEFFDPSLIPEHVDYVFLADDGRILASNMSAEARKKAVAFHRGEEISTSASAFMEIKRPEGVVVTRYAIKPRYTNLWMEDHLPPVNALFSALVVIFCFISVVATTVWWAKRLTKQLTPMLEASEQIAKQNLDFHVGESAIKEFNRVLSGLEKMRAELSEALKKNWEEEENRKNRLSALIHDLKTPIAIIQGNGELLRGTTLTEEQRNYVAFIVKNSTRISAYAQALMRMSRSSGTEAPTLEKISAAVLAERAVALAEEITSVEAFTLSTSIHVEDCFLLVDERLFDRVLQNILSNAVQYAPKQSGVELSVVTEAEHLILAVSDRGPGFSVEDFLRGTEAFYRGDASRHGSGNYGLGLYVAKEIVEKHGGRLSS
ncbi:MAG: HAMP domain-containing sensor histidine kinase [Peptoniphilus sp.]|nr:HAMP domain-containing sensor histidine kinase [Peptoniphilus sp.]MDY3119047.1 HAMP domain-containing sensor histidine kinase [Peptoniphilus sp.]